MRRRGLYLPYSTVGDGGLCQRSPLQRNTAACGCLIYARVELGPARGGEGEGEGEGAWRAEPGTRLLPQASILEGAYTRTPQWLILSVREHLPHGIWDYSHSTCPNLISIQSS